MHYFSFLYTLATQIYITGLKLKLGEEEREGDRTTTSKTGIYWLPFRAATNDYFLIDSSADLLFLAWLIH